MKAPNASANAVRIALLQRGWTRRDLSRHTGLDVETISNVIGGNSESRIARVKIEALLGVPFWSPVDSFRRWERITKVFGADPRLLTLQALRALTRKVIPSFPKHQPSRAALLRRIEEHFSASE